MSDDTAARLLWVEQLKRYTDEEFVRVAASIIYQANYVPGSETSWKEMVCYDEAIRRGDPSLYDQAWRQAHIGELGEEMSSEFPFKRGDRVRVTGTVFTIFEPQQMIGVKFSDWGMEAGFHVDSKGLDIENLGPADPANWPPQVGDIWEADGHEYFIQDFHPLNSYANIFIAGAEKKFSHYGSLLEQFKAANPRLIRRRES